MTAESRDRDHQRQQHPCLEVDREAFFVQRGGKVEEGPVDGHGAGADQRRPARPDAPGGKIDHPHGRRVQERQEQVDQRQ